MMDARTTMAIYGGVLIIIDGGNDVTGGTDHVITQGDPRVPTQSLSMLADDKKWREAVAQVQREHQRRRRKCRTHGTVDCRVATCR